MGYVGNAVPNVKWQGEKKWYHLFCEPANLNSAGAAF